MKGVEGLKSLSAQCKVTVHLGHLLLLLGLPCKTHCKSSCRGLPGTRKHCPQVEGQLNAEGSPSPSMASQGNGQLYSEAEGLGFYVISC